MPKLRFGGQSIDVPENLSSSVNKLVEMIRSGHLPESLIPKADVKTEHFLTFQGTRVGYHVNVETGSPSIRFVGGPAGTLNIDAQYGELALELFLKMCYDIVNLMLQSEIEVSETAHDLLVNLSELSEEV